MCLLRGTDWVFIYNSTFCPHSVFVCFVWIWEQTAIISLYSINWLVCITDMESVYCAVWSRALNLFQVNISDLRLTWPCTLCRILSPFAVACGPPVGDLMHGSSVTVTHSSHFSVLYMQQEAPTLNLACIKPVNQNVVWEGDLTALLLLLLHHKKYLVPRMLDVAAWYGLGVCVICSWLCPTVMMLP